jgi:methylthioxylose transferase
MATHAGARAGERQVRAVQRCRFPEWMGLAIAVLLMVLAVAIPQLLGWQVHSHNNPRNVDVPPLHSTWDPKVGAGSVPALVVAVLTWRYAVSYADRLSWRWTLAAAYATGLAWLLTLAYVDGSAGLSRALGNPYEYLQTARAITDVPEMLSEFVDRIPYSAENNWVTHVAGHPPGALLVFVLLDRLGLGGDLSAGLVVAVVAASTAPAVMSTLRVLGAEEAARRAAPFLVLAPAAVWMAVSADALFAAIGAWGLAALASAATREAWPSTVGWAAVAGLLLGWCVMMSYGLLLLGLLALAVLAVARSWRPLPVAAGCASLVVLGFAVGGFAWWEAFPVLRERYWDGVAAERPAAYWLWANVAALVFATGPALGAALGRLVALGRQADRSVRLLTSAALAIIAVADLSLMSKGEVERIWLPFVPWLLVATAVLPDRWRRVALGLQLVLALAVQHLLYTSW